MRMRRNRFGVLAAAVMGLSVMPVLGVHHLTEDDGGGGGGATETDEQKKKREEEEAKRKKTKVELTQEDLDKQKDEAVQAALKKRDEEDAAKKKQSEDEQKRKDEEERERKAKEKNDYKALYEQEQAKTREKEQAEASLRLENKQKDAQILLRDILQEKHPTYAGAAKYILPLVKVTADMSDVQMKDELTRAAEQFVKDNPRQASKGAPPSPSHGKLSKDNTGGNGGGGEDNKDIPRSYVAQRAF